MTHKILRRKIKTEQHNPNYNQGVNSGVLEGSAVLAPLVASATSICNYI